MTMPVRRGRSEIEVESKPISPRQEIPSDILLKRLEALDHKFGALVERFDKTLDPVSVIVPELNEDKSPDNVSVENMPPLFTELYSRIWKLETHVKSLESILSAVSI